MWEFESEFFGSSAPWLAVVTMRAGPLAAMGFFENNRNTLEVFIMGCGMIVNQ